MNNHIKNDLKRLLAAFIIAGATTAQAELCTIDPVPAATLLVPHFIVDLPSNCGAPGSGEGYTTRFTVRNTRAEPVLTQVNLWSDLDIPVAGFPVYLQGYASQTIDLQSILCTGELPMTSPTVTTPGSLSGPEVAYPGCGNGGLLERTRFDAPFLAHVQASLSGQPSPLTGLFSGFDLGDGIARGYVTVDTVNECSSALPTDSGYFFNGFGIASNENVLIGDYELVDPANNFALGEAAVAIEAANPPADLSDNNTFYGRYVFGTGEDQREPLPTTFLVPRDDSDDGPTQLLVWREGSEQSFGGPCPFCIQPFPLAADQVLQLTDDGEPLLPPPPFPGEPPVLPTVPFLASMLVDRVWELGLEPSPFDTGSVYLNLQTQVFGRSSPGQAWVVTLDSAQGRFQTANDAVALDSGCTALTTVTVEPTGALQDNPTATGPVTFPLIFKDGFE